MKPILFALPALALAGTVALAQPAAPPAPDQQRAAPATPDPRGTPFSRAEIDALTDARIAAIQAGLKLSPEQQRLWAPVEQAVRAIAATRADRFEERRQRMSAVQPAPGSDRDFLGRLEQRSESANRNAANLKGLTDAMKPLWASLDERQKRLLPVLLRPAGFGPGRMAYAEGGRWRERMREHHRGMDRHHGGERGGMRL